MSPRNSAVLFARPELFQCRETLFPCDFARIAWLAVRICFHGCTGCKVSLRDNNPLLKSCCVVSVAKNMFNLEHSDHVIVHSYARFVGTRINIKRMRFYRLTTTVEWLARQVKEAFPWKEAPRYLIRDSEFGPTEPLSGTAPSPRPSPPHRGRGSASRDEGGKCLRLAHASPLCTPRPSLHDSPPSPLPAKSRQDQVALAVCARRRRKRKPNGASDV